MHVLTVYVEYNEIFCGIEYKRDVNRVILTHLQASHDSRSGTLIICGLDGNLSGAVTGCGAFIRNRKGSEYRICTFIYFK